MLQPEIHRDLVRARHSDLLRQARAGELATRLAAARREERRSFLGRLQAKPEPCQPSSASTAST
jgi:hypothetical protein